MLNADASGARDPRLRLFVGWWVGSMLGQLLYHVADGMLSGHVSWPRAVPLAFAGLFFAAGMTWWLGRPRR